MNEQRLYHVETEPGWRLRTLTEDHYGVSYKVTNDPTRAMLVTKDEAERLVALLAKIGWGLGAKVVEA